MRWYFAIDEMGAERETGALARLAVLSARAVGGLEPVLLYFGARGAFTGWMQARGVRVIDARPRFLAAMERAVAAGKYKPHSIGHWLRVAVPEIEHEQDYALYTDCDVIFLRRPELAALRPKVFAAAPELAPDNWRYFNAGVMLLSIGAMRATYAGLEAQIVARIESGENYRYDDQIALNEGYAGLWDRLDPHFNWKPYWRFDRAATLLHFHGPKPSVLEAVAARGWHRTNDTAVLLEKIANARLAQYIAWCQHLGDVLQAVEFDWALRFARLASSLLRYQNDSTRDKPMADAALFGAG